MATSNSHAIPIIDLSTFLSGQSLSSQLPIAKALANSCHENGYVGLTGHGVPATLLQAAFTMMRRFFDLPLADKMKAPHPDAPTPHRGYSAPGRERAAGKATQETDDEARKEALKKSMDAKEIYDIGSEANVERNIWLPEDVLPGFRALNRELYRELQRVSRVGLAALLMGSALDEHEREMITGLHSGQDDHIRLLHYPAISLESLSPGELDRTFAHTDWSSFTLLVQDDVGGLEFANRESGEFVPAPPIADVIYMNIGDMFARLSNDFYPSSLHRVTVPKDFSDRDERTTVPSRYSIPFFVNPDAEIVISPVSSRVRVDNGAHYKPITYKEYVENGLAATRGDA